MNHLHRCIFLTLTILCSTITAAAETNTSLAVRWWGQALVSVETYWNLHIAIDPYQTRIGYDKPDIAADLVLITHEHFDHNNPALIDGHPEIVHGLKDDGTVKEIDLILDRPANAQKPQLRPASDSVEPSPHHVRVRSIRSFHDDASGDTRGRNAMFVIETSGVRILHCGDLGQSELTNRQLAAIGEIDVMFIPVGGTFTVDGQSAAAITRQVSPRIVVPVHYKTDALEGIDITTAEPFLVSLPSRYTKKEAVGNTLAVTDGHGPSHSQPWVVVLGYEPWRMPEEMAKLFDAKESAARQSQKVFEPLNVAQMNHEPSDGTHTPRWNVEHMMARELGFFTNIYSSLDSGIAAIDLNPQQMPPDYDPAHPDWTGKEEARQIQRVQAFTRRFAYLLDGKDIDKKPDGSPWTLRGLLKQMQRHYNEHTANVKKKFKLPDWPEYE